VLSVVLFLVVVGMVSPAYAFCTFTGTLSSSTIAQGTSSVTVSGTDECQAPGQIVNVYLEAGTCGSGGSTLFSSTATIGGSFDFSQSIPTSSLGAGSYCVRLTSCSAEPNCGSLITITDPLTVTGVIPEYPLGLSVLAIFMVLAYGLIKRRTRTVHS
jgi:hypothetical protein